MGGSPQGRRPIYLWLALSLFVLLVAVVLVVFFVEPARSGLSGVWEDILGAVGIGLILALAAIIIWLLWRWRGASVPHNLNRWLGAIVLIFALLGFMSFFKASGGSLSQHGYGGWIGHQIIGDSLAVGVLRFLGVVLLGVFIIAPKATWNGARRALSAIVAFYRKYPLHTYVWAFLCWLVWVYRRNPLHRYLVRRLDPERRRAAAAARPRPRVVAQVPDKPLPARSKVKETPAAAAPAGVEVAPAAEPLPAPVRAAGDKYQLPSLSLLERNPEVEPVPVDTVRGAKIIEEALRSYGVDARVVQANVGPAVTQYGIEPGWDIKTREVKRKDKDGNITVQVEEVSRTRVKVERIASLANDLALALAAPSIKIEAPIPGKSMVGIEVPNPVASSVSLRSMVESPQFEKLKAKTRLPLALGKGMSGEPIVADLCKMPHLLIAGATGSGKSVCIKSIIATFLMFDTPDELHFIMIDPKRVELVSFNKVPHLKSKVIVDVDKAVAILRYLAREMDHRYELMAAVGARDIESYNKNPRVNAPMSYLVLIIDELAELMMTSADEVERLLCRLAQLARATGIHLVVATQRPSVDVVTGLIKANFPARISFAVASQVDSRTILDTVGAEKLLGQGDMLFLPPDAPKPRRLQGSFVSDAEIERLVSFWVTQRPREMEEISLDSEIAQAKSGDSSDDVLLEKARALARDHRSISTSFLQRRLGIGYPRAAKIMDQMEAQGIVSPGEPGKPREVLMGDGEGGEVGSA